MNCVVTDEDLPTDTWNIIVYEERSYFPDFSLQEKIVLTGIENGVEDV